MTEVMINYWLPWVDFFQSLALIFATIIGALWAYNTFGYNEKIKELEKLSQSLVDLNIAVYSAWNDYWKGIKKYGEWIEHNSGQKLTNYNDLMTAGEIDTSKIHNLTSAWIKVQKDCRFLLHVPKNIREKVQGTIVFLSGHIKVNTNKKPPINSAAEYIVFDKKIESLQNIIENEVCKHKNFLFFVWNFFIQKKIRINLSLIFITTGLCVLLYIFLAPFFFVEWINPPYLLIAFTFLLLSVGFAY